MAETVHLKLKANGSDIEGESTQTSLGRENTIECIFYEQEVKTARESGTNAVQGRRIFMPLRIVKRIDKSSPLIKKALSRNERVEGEFMFFRPNPTGDGTTEKFYTVKFKEGNVSAVKDLIPNTIQVATAGEPPMEEVTFVFREITWVYEAGGVEHTDSWRGTE